MKPQGYTPIIIIGAARSGTTILKKCLSRIDGFGSFNNEINFIWCHGNAEYNTDELEPHHITPNIKRFIRERFKEFSQENSVQFVVEKSCANSLRVPFVYEIFPEAKFIFIVRDGRDAIASAMNCWLNPSNTGTKTKKIPLKDMPFYLWDSFKEKIAKWMFEKKEYQIWGPRFNGIDEIGDRFSLEEICSMQWKLSVEKAKHALAAIPDEQVYKLHYEQLVTDPENTIISLLKYLGIKLSANDVREIVKDVHPHSIGKWRKQLSPEAIEIIVSIIQDELKDENYIRTKTSV